MSGSLKVSLFALGIMLPHLPFMFEYIQDKYYQLKYATVNAYYFWLTVYYKTLKIFKYSIWFIATLFNLLVWLVYTIKNTALLIFYYADAIDNNNPDKDGRYPKKEKQRAYWRWYKDNWRFQAEQREQAKYEYRDWYKGTKFYYEEYAWKWDDAKSQQNHQEDNSSSKKQYYQDDSYYRQQEEKQQQERRAYEEQQKQQQQNRSRQEESKSYKNENEQKKYGSEYDRFFSGNHYTVLGVAKDATFDEIKSAWKTLVKQYHPDLHPENEEEFTKIVQKINEAYDYFKKMKG